MAEYQISGDKKEVSKTPVASPSANPKGGEYQITGDTVTVGRTPIPSPSANPKSGEFQKVGDSVGLNKTPVKGWGSAANLPMSQRSIDQSKGKA